MAQNAPLAPTLAGPAGRELGRGSGCADAPPLPLSRSDVAAMRGLLHSFEPDARSAALTETQCIDLLRELEELKAAAAGAQVAVTAHLSSVRHEAERLEGIAAADRGRGLASEVALACKISPYRGGRLLGLARTLHADLPHSLAALRRGELSEWRATIVVRETICLSGHQRRAVDAELWADPAQVSGLGDRQLAALTKRLAYRLDPRNVTERAARAENERFVSIRPAPDTMAYVTALLPVSQAVAVHAALLAAANAARAAGDSRSRGQVMADTLVSRLTGSAADVPARLLIQLVMTDRALFQGAADPAHLPEYGTVPAGWARELVRRALANEESCGVWLQRLLLDPLGRLVAMESRSRHAPPGLARYVATRDAGICRTPWCDAPVRHIDHVHPQAAGGPTSQANLQGLCEQCNYVKSRRGWSATTAGHDPPGGDLRAGPAIDTHTPTGHSYQSPAPSLSVD